MRKKGTALTDTEILEKLLENLPDTYQKTIGFPVHDILAAVSLQFADFDSLLSRIRKKLNPQYLSGVELDRYILPRTGLERRQATFAHGILRVTGTGTIHRGALFASAGGVQFAAVEETEIAGETEIAVSCRQSGESGNLPAHTITLMPVTITGIHACDNPFPMTGGYAEENDASYLQRHYIKVRTPPTSGNVHHYLSWALEVAGVGYAKVFPCGHGENTVDVVIINSSGQPADAELVQTVQNYIDPDSAGGGNGCAPIGARCFVSAAVEKPVSLHVTISKLADTDTDALTHEIKKAVSAYFGKAAFQESGISYAQVTRTVLDVSGVVDVSRLQLDGGFENIAVGARECAVLGACVIEYAV